jgi:nitrogen regulatory protein PII
VKNLKLITVIVERGRAKKIVDELLKINVTGATLFYARGTGVRQKIGILGKLIEPEKEVFMIVVKEEVADSIFEKIVELAKLDKPGKGIAFIQNIEKVAGFFEG